MTTTPDHSDADLATARTQARRPATTLTAGAALTIQTSTHELIITDPRELASGIILADPATSPACWEHTIWDRLGPLPSYPADHPARPLTPGGDTSRGCHPAAGDATSSEHRSAQP